MDMKPARKSTPFELAAEVPTSSAMDSYGVDYCIPRNFSESDEHKTKHEALLEMNRAHVVNSTGTAIGDDGDGLGIDIKHIANATHTQMNLTPGKGKQPAKLQAKGTDSGFYSLQYMSSFEHGFSVPTPLQLKTGSPVSPSSLGDEDDYYLEKRYDSQSISARDDPSRSTSSVNPFAEIVGQIVHIGKTPSSIHNEHKGLTGHHETVAGSIRDIGSHDVPYPKLGNFGDGFGSQRGDVVTKPVFSEDPVLPMQHPFALGHSFPSTNSENVSQSLENTFLENAFLDARALPFNLKSTSSATSSTDSKLSLEMMQHGNYVPPNNQRPHSHFLPVGADQQHHHLGYEPHQLRNNQFVEPRYSFPRAGGGSVTGDGDHQSSSFRPRVPSLKTKSGLDDGASLRHSGPTHGSLSNSLEKDKIVKTDDETQQGKAAYKEFCKGFKAAERVSPHAVIKYARENLERVPDCSRWRGFIDVADYAKRQNDIAAARRWYAALCEQYPHITQAWLEWSKLEEDIGNIRKSLKILGFGLYCNPFNENLVAKAIKLFERTRSLQMPRKAILSSLRHENIQNVWKSVFEGALLEARDGNTLIAREFYLYLLEGIHWYGPIYYEAYRLEEKLGYHYEAVRIIRAGLQSLPKYGPLWFGLLRMLEREDVAEEQKSWFKAADVGGIAVPKMRRLRSEVPVAVGSISKELVWKIYFELGQAEWRAAVRVADIATEGLRESSGRAVFAEYLDQLLNPARNAFAKSAVHCPANLKWKVWAAGARMELSVDNVHRARGLISQAVKEVPTKSRSQVYVEAARLEEYCGNPGVSRILLDKACDDVSSDWKLFLEAVLVEVRCGRISSAIRTAETALRQHSGTGRLWALLIQLHHRRHRRRTDDGNGGSDDVNTVLRRALHEVPKSGEVWCEAARTHMNPYLLDRFDLRLAQTHLSFAIQFTPQYGDTFVEYLKLEVLTQVMLPRVLAMIGLPTIPFVAKYLTSDAESDTAVGLLRPKSDSWLLSKPFRLLDLSQMKANIDQMLAGTCCNVVDRQKLRVVHTVELERRCLCADPNYGALWFHCRASPIDCPAQILDRALNILSHELCANQGIYVQALLCYILRCIQSDNDSFNIDDIPPSTVAEVPSALQMRQPSTAASFDFSALQSDRAVAWSECVRSPLSSSCSSLPYQSSDTVGATLVSSSALTPRRNREQLRHGRLKDRLRLRWQPRGHGPELLDEDDSDPQPLLLSEWRAVVHDHWCMWVKSVPVLGHLVEQSLATCRDEVAGESHTCGDFVSGCVGFSRLQFKSDATASELRYLLYATDEIIP